MFCDEDTGMCVGIMSVNLGNGTLAPSGKRRQSGSYESYNTKLYATVETHFSASSDNYSICRRQPYFHSCPSPNPPVTEEDIASAMVNLRSPMPCEIEQLYGKMQRNRDKVYKSPPDSEPTFFTETGDVPNDCRTVDTAVYDVILAMLREKKLTNRAN